LGAIARNLLERTQVMQAEFQFRRTETQPSPTNTLSTPPTQTTPTSHEYIEPVTLTPREQNVLQHLSQGYSNAQIGDEIHLSPRTIEKYVSRLLQKTGTSNRANLVRFAIEQNLIN
ncbi:MAG: LuxR C-terminal-related transcriptional regulator, partial [Cyanobacteria bacterium P01_H01_bin.121]